MNNQPLTWVSDDKGGYVAGVFSVYETRPGVWRSIRDAAHGHGAELVNPGTTLEEAKAACEKYRKSFQARKEARPALATQPEHSQ